MTKGIPVNSYAGTSMAWIDERDYEAFRARLADGATLPARYEEWRSHVQRRIDMFAVQGHAMVKVKINLDDFVAWCVKTETPISAAGCQLYAVAMLASGESQG
ncbi:hypothetical protein [Burkholderia glumae]|uniref:hypothetical protein n=1 Tax=Burkholderia glumae TaxID=337 RepID=UPI0021514C78|nr:hypothetical protein [Burkholderia glumae]